MESHTVNFNYEYELYQSPAPAWLNKVLQSSMECLYFYCNEELPLSTDIQYDDEFLRYVDAKLVPSTKLSKLWWGEFSSISKLSNCKLENHLLNKQLNLWTPTGGIVTSFEELKKMMTEGRWRLKDPWMMGGTGQWRISLEMLEQDSLRKGIQKRLQKGPLLLEQSLEIKRVIGTTFNINDNSIEKLFSVENYLNSQGNFIGGKLIETPKQIKDELFQVVNSWKEKGARGTLEIDSFELEDSTFYPCVEVNHRKTMGWFIWNLCLKFGPGSLLINSDSGIQLNPKTSLMKASWVKT